MGIFTFNKLTKYIMIFTVMLFSGLLMAQKPMEKRAIEISLEADEYIATEIKNNQRVNTATGYPIALYGLDVEVAQGTPEAMAMAYLQEHSKTLGIPTDALGNLQHHATRTTNAGSVVRYRQFYQGLPVNRAEVTISISPQGKVVYVMNSYEQGVNLNTTTPSISKDAAYQRALNHIQIVNPVTYSANNLVVYKNTKMTRLAHEVVISTSNPLGEWHVFVDATDGSIFKVADNNHYYCDTKHDTHDANCEHDTNNNSDMAVRRYRVDGTGMVFNPDPLSSNQVAYGTSGYVDGNDATTTQLDAARFSVTLPDITVSGGMYSLVGPRAEIIDFDNPTTGLFMQNSPNFNFNREEQGFEPVNVYYHIDFMMNYINNTLGCDVMPYQYTGGVQYDPHGANGGDNSYYTGAAGRLAFGEGCVDDAEDSDVIHHELGHGLHDWVTNGGLSQVNGLSEGCGDYVAQSYNRSLGNWGPTDAAYNFVFNWDGHNECWPGRTTAHTAAYPGGLVGQIHADGQIWATCLMGIWDQIGQQQMDKIFYEGLGMTNGTASQNDAAVAVYQAAINLNYSSADIVTIHTSLTDCGYTLPALPGPPTADFTADSMTICLDTNNTVNFMDATVPNATTWSWTFEGGTPATSNAQNPTVTYAAVGTYNVTLAVTNSEGNDTKTVNDFITVVSGNDCPSCTMYNYSGSAIAISENGANNEYTSTVNVPVSGTSVTDINVTINIEHTWAGDIDAFLISPTGTEVELTSDNGSGDDNYTNTIFDMDGADGNITAGSAPFTGTYIPEGDLSQFNGEDPMGNWTLRVVDDANQDGGQILSWGVEICSESLSIPEFTSGQFNIYPNPNNGTFTIAATAAIKDVTVEVFDIRGRQVFSNSYNSLSSETVSLPNVQSGMYMLKVSSPTASLTKKIVVK